MGLYLGGLIIGRIFASEIWGAYFREGLYLGGLIIGILRYYNFRCSVGSISSMLGQGKWSCGRLYAQVLGCCTVLSLLAVFIILYASPKFISEATLCTL